MKETERMRKGKMNRRENGIMNEQRIFIVLHHAVCREIHTKKNKQFLLYFLDKLPTNFKELNNVSGM